MIKCLLQWIHRRNWIATLVFRTKPSGIVFPPAGIEADAITSWIDDKRGKINRRPCSRSTPYTKSPLQLLSKTFGIISPFFFYSTKIPGDIWGSFQSHFFGELHRHTQKRRTDGKKFEKVGGDFVGSTLFVTKCCLYSLTASVLDKDRLSPTRWLGLPETANGSIRWACCCWDSTVGFICTDCCCWRAPILAEDDEAGAGVDTERWKPWPGEILGWCWAPFWAAMVNLQIE